MREVPGAVRGGQLSALLLVGVLLVAANLRAALTGVGPLLPDIGRSTGLSGTWTGLLSTLPLLTFAATSPLVGRTTHRYGAPRILGLSLAVLAVGLLLRSFPARSSCSRALWWSPPRSPTATCCCRPWSRAPCRRTGSAR